MAYESCKLTGRVKSQTQTEAIKSLRKWTLDLGDKIRNRYINTKGWKLLQLVYLEEYISKLNQLKWFGVSGNIYFFHGEPH